MGCPDWPKCFDQYVPPTSEAELPENYQEFYSNYRHQKNVRFVRYLDFFGFNELGEQILNDPNVKKEAEFNAAKTWTEYINRLLGALVGFLILCCFLFSWKYLRKDKVIPIVASLSLVLVLLQAWIGSVVVSTNLLSGLITIHMLLALVIIGLLVLLNHRASLLKSEPNKATAVPSKINFLILGSVCLMVIQIILGTDVRESVDVISSSLGESKRSQWIEELSTNFYIHRSFSLFILGWNLYLWYCVIKLKNLPNNIRLQMNILVSFFVVTIVSGAAMAYFSIPFWLQPLHLVLGALIIGSLVQLYLSLKSVNSRKSKERYVYS
jgi:cytochrome c oxidase assembly protein subunit 15